MAISTPPAIWTMSIVSPSRTTAQIAAANGCRFVASVARRGADPVERVEPEDVGDDERPERREHEQHPHLPAEAPVLRARLRQADQRDPDPRERQHYGADPGRRVAGHQRRDQDRVHGPGRGGEDPPQDPGRVAADLTAGAERHERDAGHGERCPGPEAARQHLRAEGEPDQRGEDRRRGEDQRDHRGRRGLERVDEADLVDEEGCGGRHDKAEIAPFDPQRPFRREHDRDKDERGERVAHCRVGERLKPVCEDVAADGEVERPQPDRRQQHHLDRRRLPHSVDASR